MPYKDREKQKEYMRNWYYENKGKKGDYNECEHGTMGGKKHCVKCTPSLINPKPLNPKPVNREITYAEIFEKENALRIILKAKRGKISNQDAIALLTIIFNL